MKKLLLAVCLLVLATAGCAPPAPAQEPAPPALPAPDRASSIPATQHKITPEEDPLPPILHSSEYSQPVPLPFPVNTAGAEDSAFIMPDGQTLYVWFTPDPNAPLGEQLGDGVTGIWEAKKAGGIWQEPERVLLQEPGKQALDGCEFIQDGVMWFCTARTGYSGLHWFKAENSGGQWADWQEADFDPSYEVGELHITADGRELYFHSPRAGGQGQYDIWVSRNENGIWQPPEDVTAVNSPETDGWPFVTRDGGELWFTRFYQGSPAIFRSKKSNGQWQEPELIISQFAGECSLDDAGNIYFSHHFYKDGVALEADIYVARRIAH